MKRKEIQLMIKKREKLLDEIEELLEKNKKRLEKLEKQLSDQRSSRFIPSMKM